MSEGPTMMYPAYTPLPISPYQPFYTVSGRPPQWSAPLYYPSPSDASFFLPQPVVSPPSSNSEEHTDDEKNGRDYSNPINLTTNSVVVSPTVQRPETPPHPSQESSRSPTRSVKYKSASPYVRPSYPAEPLFSQMVQICAIWADLPKWHRLYFVSHPLYMCRATHPLVILVFTRKIT